MPHLLPDIAPIASGESGEEMRMWLTERIESCSRLSPGKAKLLSQYLGVCNERQYSIPELAAMYKLSEETISNLLRYSIARLHIRRRHDHRYLID